MTFDQHYQELFGEEWEFIKSKLLKGRQHVARLTRKGLVHLSKLSDVRTVFGVEGCYAPDTPIIADLVETRPDSFYLMDVGSVLAARQLVSQCAKSIWDVCAAPGGKSLILLENKTPEVDLTLTDLSRPRLERLKQVIRQYHGDEAFEARNLKLVSTDSVNWGYRNQQKYDRVLLDAPCSSERHVLADEKALAQWTPNRVKSLAKRQYALLCSALLACEIGGSVLYSTCSIHPAENDGVIARYLKKKGNIEVLPCETPIGIKTEHGTMIRPDLHDGWGPMYFALLKRIA